jgi:hypothetical protein
LSKVHSELVPHHILLHVYAIIGVISCDHSLRFQLSKLHDEVQRKESKWTSALSKLQEQVKFLERENQHLHEENHRLKVKGVASKVRQNGHIFGIGNDSGFFKISTSLKGDVIKFGLEPQVICLKPPQDLSPSSASSKHSVSTPDSGFRSQHCNIGGSQNAMIDSLSAANSNQLHSQVDPQIVDYFV